MGWDSLIASCATQFTFGLLFIGFITEAINGWKFALACAVSASFTAVMHVVILINHKDSDDVFWMLLSFATAGLMFIHTKRVKSKLERRF